MSKRNTNKILYLIKCFFFEHYNNKALTTQAIMDARNSISKGDLENALCILDTIAMEKKDEVLALKSRLSYLEHCTITGVLPYEFLWLERQKIAHSAILICSKLDKIEEQQLS